LRIVTVDGCEFECSRKTVEAAGFRVTKSIVLTRDLGIRKKPLHEDIGKEMKNLMEYVSDEDVERAKQLILRAITGNP
jgi:uncharacterized metal-binding protein